MKKIISLIIVFLIALSSFTVYAEDGVSLSTSVLVKALQSRNYDSIFKPKNKKSKKIWNQYHNRICGKKYEDGTIKFIMSAKGAGKARQTGNDLQYLLENNRKKTIILPKKKIKIERVLMPGNNTTIIAKGATIYQTDRNKPILTSYSSWGYQQPVKNLKIVGGKWRVKGNAKNTRPTSYFRFMHSKKIKLQKLDIETNYISHGIELLACKNVTIDKCKVLALGKNRKRS